MSQSVAEGARRETPTADAGPRRNPWLTLLAVAVGVMMVALDATIVAVANPAIQSHLHASLSDIQWVTNGYLLSLAVFLITAGKIGDRFGHRGTFLIGAIGFAAASAAIGLSGSIALIVTFRVLQGLFGALLQPAALGLLRAAFPLDRLNTAIGIWGGVIGTSTAAGPIVGGLLVEHLGWQSVFYVNVPVGIAAVALGLAVLPRTRAVRDGSSFDIPGMALLSAAMFMLVWGLIKAPDWGWGNAGTLAFLVGALAVGAVFVFWQTRAAHPLLPLSLFRSVALSAGTVLMILMMFAFLGAVFFVTFYLQNVHGLSPVSSGLHLLPMTGTMIVASPLAGAIMVKTGPRMPIVAGMLLTAAALFGLSQLHVDSGAGIMSLWFVLLGMGLSPVLVGATEVIVGNAPLELAGVAGGLQQAASQVGGTLGTAVLGALMAARVGHVLPGNWTAAGLPPSTAQQYASMQQAVQVGVAPVTPNTPAPMVHAITQAAHASFMSGMMLSFLVAGSVAVVAAAVGLLTKAGSTKTTAAGHI